MAEVLGSVEGAWEKTGGGAWAAQGAWGGRGGRTSHVVPGLSSHSGTEPWRASSSALQRVWTSGQGH